MRRITAAAASPLCQSFACLVPIRNVCSWSSCDEALWGQRRSLAVIILDSTTDKIDAVCRYHARLHWFHQTWPRGRLPLFAKLHVCVAAPQMKRPSSSWLIFMLGLVPVALWTGALRSSLGDWLALAAVIVYLLLLRLVGDFVMHALRRRAGRNST